MNKPKRKDDPDAHTYVEQAYYRAFERCLECDCGFIASGGTWEDAGAQFDVHLEEVRDADTARFAKE